MCQKLRMFVPGLLLLGAFVLSFSLSLPVSAASTTVSSHGDVQSQLRDVRSRRGYNQGFANGFSQGYEAGYEACLEHQHSQDFRNQTHRFDDPLSPYNQGFSDGYAQGFKLGLHSCSQGDDNSNDHDFTHNKHDHDRLLDREKSALSKFALSK